MFGSLGTPERITIFVIALIVFGPRKLPELGKSLGRSLAEFKRASNELKATFDREMKTLERETESIKEEANKFHSDTYNYIGGRPANFPIRERVFRWRHPHPGIGVH